MTQWLLLVEVKKRSFERLLRTLRKVTRNSPQCKQEFQSGFDLKTFESGAEWLIHYAKASCSVRQAGVISENNTKKGLFDSSVA